MNGPPPAKVLSEVLRRLLYLSKLRAAALSVTRPAGPRDRLRASELAERVAALVQVENSPWFRRDLSVALRAVGWRSVLRATIRHWCGQELQ